MAIETAELGSAILAKEERLLALLHGYGSLAVAYSGGVDSTYLADVAHQALAEGATLILADSPSLPRAEFDEAVALAQARGWNLTVIETAEFEREDYLKNDGTRCYVCRSELFTKMQAYAQTNGIRVMAYGAIMDDLLDPTRLGTKAAAEHQVVAPLQAAELAKSEIRALSRQRGLPTWEKASFACLASRFPVGTRVTREEVMQVERAEDVLRNMGFRQYRARHHGDLCRVELDPAEIERLLDPALRAMLDRELKALGYRHVALDLAGYRGAGGEA